MLDKIYIIDFNDSFTYNIANVIFPFESQLQVISCEVFFSITIYSILESPYRHAIILGPGPGHPDEYSHFYPSLTKILAQKNLYLMGICLGHQILGRMKGYEVRASKSQIHGQQELIRFQDKDYLVQRYNSLSVYRGHTEELISIFPQGISYQFHPESIGTNEKHVFFKELLSFIKSS